VIFILIDELLCNSGINTGMGKLC